MSTHNTAEKLDSTASRLMTMSQQLKLLAFAAEARRTLEGINDLTLLVPELEGTLAGGVTAWRCWSGFEDVSGSLLQSLAHEAEELFGLLDDATANVRTQATKAANRSRAQ